MDLLLSSGRLSPVLPSPPKQQPDYPFFMEDVLIYSG